MIYKHVKCQADFNESVKNSRMIYSPDCEYIYVFKKYRKSRTVNQNRLYWLWLNAIEDETGNEKEMLHIFFRNKFLKPIDKIVFCNTVKLSPSTSNLNTKEFTDYMDKIQRFVGEYGIVLPTKEHPYYDEFIERYRH